MSGRPAKHEQLARVLIAGMVGAVALCLIIGGTSSAILAAQKAGWM